MVFIGREFWFLWIRKVTNFPSGAKAGNFYKLIRTVFGNGKAMASHSTMQALHFQRRRPFRELYPHWKPRTIEFDDAFVKLDVVIDICRPAQGRWLPCRKPMRHNNGKRHPRWWICSIQLLQSFHTYMPTCLLSEVKVVSIHELHKPQSTELIFLTQRIK